MARCNTHGEAISLCGCPESEARYTPHAPPADARATAEALVERIKEISLSPIGTTQVFVRAADEIEKALAAAYAAGVEAGPEGEERANAPDSPAESTHGAREKNVQNV